MQALELLGVAQLGSGLLATATETYTRLNDIYRNRYAEEHPFASTHLDEIQVCVARPVVAVSVLPSRKSVLVSQAALQTEHVPWRSFLPATLPARRQAETAHPRVHVAVGSTSRSSPSGQQETRPAVVSPVRPSQPLPAAADLVSSNPPRWPQTLSAQLGSRARPLQAVFNMPVDSGFPSPPAVAQSGRLGELAAGDSIDVWDADQLTPERFMHYVQTA